MSKGFQILFSFLIFININFAQLKPCARQAALSFSDYASSNNIFAIFYNPAGLSYFSNNYAGFSYIPSPFGLKELSTAYLSLVYPFKSGTFGAGVMIYGFELYKETQFAFCYSKSLSNNFSIGITSIYKNLSIKNYGTKGYFIFNAGSTVRLTDNFNLGFSIENFLRTSIRKEDNQFPVILSSGIYYKPVEALNIFASIIKELNYNFSFRSGIEYELLNFLTLRIGTMNQPEEFSGGFGFVYKFISLDYAALSHPDLGITHTFGLAIQF